MPTRRIMKGVLANFLGAYTSRYSDYRGYWLHGQLQFGSPQYEFDLLDSTPDAEDTPESAAWRLAISRFAEQIMKSGLSLSMIREANLKICMKSESVNGWHGDQMGTGHMVQFVTSAVMDNEQVYEIQRVVFVAPHNPKMERRRHSDMWGN